MNKKVVIVISSLGLIILILGLIFFGTNVVIKNKNSIQVIDATYACVKSNEKFYEDDEYVYYFPCVKSKSIYVKFSNGNKMLIVDALENEMVTIDALLDAGLDVYKQKK